MMLRAFPYASPLGNVPGRLLLEAPPAEIGSVLYGFSSVTEDVVRRLPAVQQRTRRPWWHPLRNPIVTAVVMACAALFAVQAALHEAAVPGLVGLVAGYGVAKAAGAVVTLFRPFPPMTNLVVGEHGMLDVDGSPAASREVTLWKDIAWWGATPLSINGHPRLLTHIVDRAGHVRSPGGFSFRFKAHPSVDAETAVLEAGRAQWTSWKVAEIARLLGDAPGGAVDMPLLTDERVRPTVLRPASYVRVSQERITACVDGKVAFDAPRTATTLTFESRVDAWANATRSFCVLRAHDTSWGVRCAELPGMEVLMHFIPRAA